MCVCVCVRVPCVKTERQRGEREEGISGSFTACYKWNKSMTFFGKTSVKMSNVPLLVSVVELVLH